MVATSSLGHGQGKLHTLWVANDNDFLAQVPDPLGNLVPNGNQSFVFGFTDASVGGSKMMLRKIAETKQQQAGPF